MYLHREQVWIKNLWAPGCHARMWRLRECGLPAHGLLLVSTSSLPGSRTREGQCMHMCGHPGLHIQDPPLQTATLWLLLGLRACCRENRPEKGPRIGLGFIQVWNSQVSGTQGMVWKRRCKLQMSTSPWPHTLYPAERDTASGEPQVSGRGDPSFLSLRALLLLPV